MDSNSSSAIVNFMSYWRTIRILFLVIVALMASVHAASAFQIGDRLEVFSSNGVKVRDVPAGTQVDAVPKGYRGKIIGGPTNKQLGGTGYNYRWWQVDWDSSYLTGWIAEGDASGLFITIIPSAAVNFQSQPTSNVAIAFAPINLSSVASGNTSFTSSWDYDTQITIGASTPLSDGSTFVRWLKNGSQYSTSSYVTNIQISQGDTFTAVYQVPPQTGNINVTVNAASGGALATSEINAVLLFPSTPGPSVDRLQPPSSNPMTFGSRAYGNYQVRVYCWDQLAATSPVFNHSLSNTPVTLVANIKRPLTVYASRSGGFGVVAGATMTLYSWNGQFSQWNQRAQGTTDSTGAWTINAWPTTDFAGGEKYRVSVTYGGTEVGSNSAIDLPDQAVGRTISIETSVPPQVPSITTLAATSVTASSAVLNARITDSGGSAIDERRFDWGTTSNGAWPAGNWTTAVTVSGTDFSFTLNNLNPSTTYYFRAWAHNNSGVKNGSLATGWNIGSIVSFTTSSSTTGSASILDAWWSNVVDIDGDGYKRSARLNWDPDVAGGSSSVFEKIYFRQSSSSAWTAFATTSPHTVSGTTNPDQQYLDVSTGSLSRDSYDWRIEIYRNGQSIADFTRDPNNDSDLAGFSMESASEDVFTDRPTAKITRLTSVALHVPVNFSAADSKPVPGRPITSYAWTFSDGFTAFTRDVQHPFKSGSVGSASLRVWDGIAWSEYAIDKFNIDGVGNPPQAKNANSNDPVNTATGNFVMNPTLLSVSSRGLPFVFQAFYNSKTFDPADTTATQGALGYGWTHSFEINARDQGSSDGVRYVIIGFGDGHKEKYTLTANGWATTPGIYNKLTEAADGSFALVSPNQIKTQFNPAGNLVSISDRNGNTLGFVWNSAPLRIANVTLPGGPDANGNPRKVLFDYDPVSGHLSKLTDPINRTVEFTVDASHDLNAIKNVRGFTTTYTYDALHQMLTGTDARTHRFVRNLYQDRVVTEQYDVDDNKTTFEYPFTLNATITFTRVTRKVPGGDDEITEDHHNAKLQLEERKIWIKNPANPTTTIAFSEKFGYDPVTGDRTSRIDRNGNTYAAEYTNGNLTKLTYPDGGVTFTEFDSFNNPTLITNALGIKTKFDYNATGNLIGSTSPFDPAHPNDYKRTFAVDAFGQTTAATDANNHTTHAYFNEWGENWKVEDAETPANAKTFDLDGIGRKTGVTDERGNHTTFTLNENGGAEVTTLPALPAPIGITQIKQVFDPNDNLTSVEDPLHRFTHTEFDQQDRPYKVKNHNLDTITTEFDELGRAVRVQDPKLHYSHRVYDLAGRLTEARDQMGRKHVFTFDANGNVLTDIDDDGVKIETVWDEMNRPVIQRRYNAPLPPEETITHYNILGQIDWTEDAASHVSHNRTYFYYNDAGQLIRLVEPAINGIAQEFTWTYDFEGNLLSATHTTPTGPKTRYQTWTARNQIATRTDENGQIECFFYNPVGKLDHFINANGQTIAFVYDALNRTTTIDYPGSAVDSQFTYDAAGQLIFMDDALGRTTWTYTTLGQIETVTDPYGKSLAYHYDVNGNRDRITYPGEKVANYAFDDANTMLSVTNWQPRTISRALTAAGRVATITYPNGITTTVGHDAAGRENDIQHQKGVAVPFIHFGYTFDQKGQIQEVTPTTHPLPKQAFTAASSTYTYDAANQLTSIDGITVTHDNQGNLLTGKLSPLSTGTDTLSWDIEGRLTAATIAGVTSTSSYDGQGHRLQTTHGSTTTRYVMDTTGSLAQVMAETDGSGTITAYYLYLGGLAARILPNGDLSCYHTDRAGNVLALTDSGGSTTDLYQYDEFGVPAGSSGSSQNPFRYAGGFGVQTDANGTLFSRARVYHPDLGRFLSRDALFGSQPNGQSLNRYAAFLNDPVSYGDPSGFVSQHAVSPSFYTMDMRTANSTLPFDPNADHTPLNGHDVLNAVGLIWVFGEPADVVNGLWYSYEGDHINAAFSYGGAIPVAGWLSTGGKWIRQSGKLPIWTANFKKALSPVENALAHWNKHAAEFPELLNAKQYVESAKKFFSSPPSGTLTKVRANGERVLYHPDTNTFGVQTPDGVSKTFFKPDPAEHGFKSNLDYFNDQ